MKKRIDFLRKNMQNLFKLTLKRTNVSRETFGCNRWNLKEKRKNKWFEKWKLLVFFDWMETKFKLRPKNGKFVL